MSGAVKASGSKKQVAASLNETPCLRRLARAFVPFEIAEAEGRHGSCARMPRMVPAC